MSANLFRFIEMSGASTRTAKIKLNNDDIKALPAPTYYPLTNPAPENWIFIPILAVFVMDALAGAYIFTGDATFRITTFGGSAAFGTLIEDTSDAAPLLTSGGAFLVLESLRDQFATGGDGLDPTTLLGGALEVGLAGVIETELAGGNVANSLTVYCEYMPVQVRGN